MAVPDPNSTAAAAAVPSLFRKEVMAARQAQWLGSIRIARPLSFSLMTGAALVVASVLIGYACWGEVTRKATVHGLLLPQGGLINVAAPQAGVLVEVLVQEGDAVVAGQPLLRVRAERMTVKGDAAVLTAQALATRRVSLETERRLTEQNLLQRTEALASREQSLRTEERQALAELDTHRLRLQLGKKTVDRQQELAGSGFVVAAHVQQRQEELLDLELRERSAERNLQALQRDLQAVQADREALQTQARTLLAQLERNLAALRQEATDADSRNGLIVTAPQSGRISALTLSVGQSVQVGQTLLSMVPNSQHESGEQASELQAQLFAPSRTAGFVRTGQEVWLRYAAFPFQKFGVAKGKVVAVSRSPIAPQDLPPGQAQALIAAAQSNEPMYRITVRLPGQTVRAYGEEAALVAGMSLDADVRQDSRKIWEWLLEPAFAVVGGRT
jgi:membrane fusion protein